MLKSPRMMSSKNHTILVLEFSKFPQKSESERGYLNNASDRRFVLKWNFFMNIYEQVFKEKEKIPLSQMRLCILVFSLFSLDDSLIFFLFVIIQFLLLFKSNQKAHKYLNNFLFVFGNSGLWLMTILEGLGMLLTSCQDQDAQYSFWCNWKEILFLFE